MTWVTLVRIKKNKIMFGVENYKIFREKTLFDINSFTIITGQNGSGKSTYTELQYFMTKNFVNGPQYFLDTSPIKTQNINIGNERIEHFQDLGRPITFYYNNISVQYTHDTFWNKYILSGVSFYSKETNTELVFNMFETDIGIVVEINIKEFELFIKEKERQKKINWEGVADQMKESINEINESNREMLESQGILTSQNKSEKPKESKIESVYQYCIPFNSEGLSYNKIINEEIDSYFKYEGLGYPYYYKPNSIKPHKIFDETLKPNLKLRELIGTTKKNWLNQFLKSIDFCDSIEIKELIGGLFTVEISRHGKLVPLHNLSSGEYKFVTLILFITASLEYKVEDYAHSIKHIVIEEPETALHPNLQSKIADFIAHLYTFPVFDDLPDQLSQQFVFETHSEYIIRKIQYLVAKGKIPNCDISLYYFETIDGKCSPYEIEIRQDGALSQEFGSGFFDEADNIAIELFRVTKTRSN